MSKWFDNSANSNKLRQSYIKGFVDISGAGGLSIRNNSKINLYPANGTSTPNFSMNSDTMHVYDGYSTFYDISLSKLIHLKGIDSDLANNLTDLINRTAHINSNTTDIDTMMNFDTSNNQITLYANVIPSTPGTYNLGTPDIPFKSIYVNQGTIHFINPDTGAETAALSYDDIAGYLNVIIGGETTPLNLTKTVNGVYQTPLMSYNGNVGIGVVNPQSALDIAGSVSIMGETIINGPLQIAGQNDVNMQGNLIIGSTIYEQGIPLNSKYLSVNSPVMKGDAHVPSITVSNDLYVEGNSYLKTNVNVGGDLSLNGDLNIYGNLYARTVPSNISSSIVATTAFVHNQGYAPLTSPAFIGTVTMSNSNVNQKLNVTGDVSLNSKLAVFSTASFGGKVNIVGNSLLSGTLSVLSDASFAANTYATTVATNDNSSHVATTAYVQNQGYAALAGATFTGGLNAGNTLSVVGDTSLNGNFFIRGDTSFNGNVLAFTQLTADNSSRVATTAYVQNQGYATLASPSFTGSATADKLIVTGDASMNGRLQINGESKFNGNLLATTQLVTDNSTRVATTAYVQNQGYATLASPTFTGSVTMPTTNTQNLNITGDISLNGNMVTNKNVNFNGNAYAKTQQNSDNSTLIATTAYVKNQGYATTASPTFGGIVTSTGPMFVKDISMGGNLLVTGNTTMLGNSTAITPPSTDNSTLIATTAYVQNQAYATLVSPNFTGIPTAPTPGVGDTTTKVATTEYVRNEIVSFVNSIPSAFDAINQLSTALSNSDASFAVSLSQSVGLKANLISPVFVGTVELPQVIIDGNVTSYGNVTMNNSLKVIGDTDISGTLTTLTQPVSDNSRKVATTAYVQNQGYAQLTGAAFTGPVSTNRLTVTSDANLNNRLFVTNDTNMSGNLYVNKSATLNGNVVLNNGLVVSTDSSFNANLYVAGNITTVTPNTTDNSNRVATTAYVKNEGYAKLAGSNFTGSVSMGSSLHVSNDVSMNGNVIMNGNTVVNSKLAVANDVSMNSNLQVAGTIYENGSSLITKYATLASPTFTGTVSGITASMVGLNNVNNTSDINKPISNATQSALYLKANLDSPAFTGNATIANVSVSVLGVSGDTTLSSRLYVNSDVSVNGGIYTPTPFTGDNSSRVATTAFVNNQSYVKSTGGRFTGDVSFSNVEMMGKTVLDSSLYVSSDTSMNGNLYVKGKTTLSNDVSMNNRLSITGDVSMNSNVFIKGTAYIGGDISLNGNLIMKGQSSASTPATNDNSTAIATTAFVKNQNYAQLSGANFIGDVSFNQNVLVLGSTTINSSVAIGGDVSLNSRLFMAGDSAIGGNNKVVGKSLLTGDVSMNSRLAVSGDVSMNGKLFVSKDITTNGNISAIGTMSAATPDVADNSSKVATTAYVQNQGYSTLASPTFTGTVNMPSAVVSQNLSVAADAYLSAGLFVTNNATVGGTLGVTGAITSATPSSTENSTVVATTAFVQQSFANLTSPSFLGNVKLPKTDICGNVTVLGDVSVNGIINSHTPSVGDNSTKLATTAFVNNSFAPLANPAFTGDASFGGNLSVGSVIYENGSSLVSKYATLASPAFTGTVTGITASMVGLNQVNNTSDISKPISTATQSALDLKANVDSAAFTGNMTANNLAISGNLTSVTPSVYDNSTKVATTAYVQGQNFAQLTGAAFTGSLSTTQNFLASGNVVISKNTLIGGNASITGRLTVNGDVSLNGNTTGTTPFAGDNSTKLATTAYVQNQGFAFLSSPNFTGVPTAPTASTTSTTSNQLATTLYVENKISDFFSTASASTIQSINALSQALSNTDTSFTTYIANQLSTKANVVSPEFSGTVIMDNNLVVGSDASFGGNLIVNNTIYEGGLALAQKYATLTSPAFKGTVTGITASMVGLDQVNNTADMDKPISTATLSALTVKANLIAPEFVGPVKMSNTLDVSENLYVGGNTTISKNLRVNGNITQNGSLLSSIYAPLASPAFTGTVTGVTAAMVGLDQVNNTSDYDKPISHLTDTALSLKANVIMPSFIGPVSISQGLIVNGDSSFNTRLFVGGDISHNGVMTTTTQPNSDNSNKVATTAYVNNISQTYVRTSGDVSLNSRLYVVGDICANSNLYLGGDISVNGFINAKYKANTIPFNAIIGGLGTNVDLSTNQTIGGIKTFTQDVSMQSQIFITGNSNISSNNIVSSLYQTSAPDPSSTTISNLSKVTNNYNGTFITEFEISKANGSVLSYNLANGATNVSVDGGMSWKATTLIGTNTGFSGMLCLSPDGRIRLQQQTQGTTNNLYISTNWGSSYTLLSLAKNILYTNSYFNYNTYNTQTYAFSHDGTVLYFIARDTNNTVVIWKSTDNTFSNFTNQSLSWNYSLNNCPRSIATSNNGQYVLTITGVVPANGMYLSISTNYGASFTRTANAVNTTWNFIAVSYSGKYMTATSASQLFQSSDYGSTWAVVTSVPTSNITWNSVSISNDGKNRLLASTNGFQYASFDYGSTWAVIPNSYGNWKKSVITDISNNNSFTCYSHDGVNIYKNSYSTQAINQSTAINTDVNIVTPNYYLNTLGKVNKVVKTNVFNNFVGGNAGMSQTGQYIVLPISRNQTIISQNYGESWSVLNGLTAQTGYYSAAVSGTGQIMYIRNGTTTYRSANYGSTWSLYTTLVVNDQLCGTALSYNGQYIVFAGQDPATSNSNIYVSTNFGVSWTTAATFPTQNNLFSAAISSNGEYMSVLSTTSYVLVSSDYGSTWSIKYINALLTSNYIAMSSTGQYQTVVGSNTIYSSNDYGNTFTSTFVGDASSNFTKVTMIGSGQAQYAVNNGNNYLYRSLNYGVTWAPVLTNSSAPYNTLVSSEGKFMLYSVSGDIMVSRVANNVGTISETAVSISTAGMISAIDLSVNGAISTQTLIVNQIYENGNVLGSKYATINSPAFTGTVSGITGAMVGLGNVNNTSDINKPVSTATQAALNLKADISNTTLTGLTNIGNAIISNKLTVGGDVSMNGRLYISGDVSLNGTLYANYAPNTIPTTAIIGGIPVATGVFDQDISGNARLYIAGDSSLNGNLVVRGNTALNNNLYVGLDTSLNGNLFINGVSLISGDVSMNNRLNIAGKLTVNNDVSMNGNLRVSKGIFINGNSIETIYAPLAGPSFTYTSTFEKVHITQELINDSDTTLNGNLTVALDTNINGNLRAAKTIFENGSSLITKYATLASPTFTGTVSGITATMVGLGNVNNTSDVNKPISTATQSALDLKANILSPDLSGVPTAPTAATGTATRQIATTAFVNSGLTAIVGGSPSGLQTLGQLAAAINNDVSFSNTIQTAISAKANSLNPVFSGSMTTTNMIVNNQLSVLHDTSLNGRVFMTNDISMSGHVTTRDVSMNGNVVILHDISVNGNITAHYPNSSIPSSAIDFIQNNYREVLINTQRVDRIEYDDEFFEVSAPSGFNGYTEVFYSTDADLSMSGNLTINGSGTSSFNTNVDILGGLVANQYLDIYGVINQQNDIIDDGTYVSTHLLELQDLNTIKNVVEYDASNVSLGVSGYSVEIVGDLSTNGLHINKTSSHNTCVGYNTDLNINHGSNNLLLGYNAAPSTSSVSNEITLGNSSITALRCNVNAITALSDARDKKDIEPIPLGLDFIGKLNPVKFTWNTRDGSKIDKDEFGFIAQELKESQEKVGVIVPNLVYEENPEKLEASYSTLLPIMVKAIQELKELVIIQQEEINMLKSQLR